MTVHLKFKATSIEWPVRFRNAFQRYKAAGLVHYWYGTDHHYVLVVSHRLGRKDGGK